MKKSTPTIYSQLSKKYGIPYQVIEVICNSPFKFASEKISDANDDRPIMFAYLGKFKLKKRYEKEQSKRVLSRSVSEDIMDSN